MFRNIFLKTLRDYRLQILIWGGGIGLIMAAIPASYDGLFVGPTREFQVQQFVKISNSLSFLIGQAHDIDTLGGFVDSRYTFDFTVILSIFALIAGSGLLRGDEERGLLDLLASTPHSRTSILLQKWVGLVVILAGMGLLIWLGLMLGTPASKYSLDAGAAALTDLNMALIALFFGTVAFVVGQFTTRKATMGWTGGLLVTAWLFNSLAALVKPLNWLGTFSPFYYLNLNKPLSRSVGANWGALTVLLLAPLPLLALAAWLYQHRDQNDTVHLFGRRKAVPNNISYSTPEPKSIWLANPFNFAVKSYLLMTLIWSAGFALYLVVIMSVYNQIRDSLVSVLSSSDLYKNLGFGGLMTNELLISVLIFIFLVIVYAAFAVQEVSGWTGEENEGRLEMLLSTPQPRWRLLLSRFGATLLMSGIAAGLVGLVYALLILIANIQVDAAKSFEAFFGLWVVCVIVVAAGFLIAALKPGFAVAIIGGLVIVSYLTDLFTPLFKLPDWLDNLTIFHQYGRPLTDGINWNAQFVMLGLSVAFIAIAIFRFGRRDIVK